MSAPDPRVGEIEARLAAATPGPWELFGTLAQWEAEEDLSFGPDDAPEVGIVREGLGDAEFIAAAPADVAYLLAELRKAHAALARVEGVATDLATRGAAIEAKGYNGSINSNRDEGRSAGYLEGARLIRAAVADANGDGE